VHKKPGYTQSLSCESQLSDHLVSAKQWQRSS